MAIARSFGGAIDFVGVSVQAAATAAMAAIAIHLVELKVMVTSHIRRPAKRTCGGQRRFASTMQYRQRTAIRQLVHSQSRKDHSTQYVDFSKNAVDILAPSCHFAAFSNVYRNVTV
jgi:hypothetical protein